MSDLAHVDTIYIKENEFTIRWADGRVDKGSRGSGMFVIQGIELRVLVSATTEPLDQPKGDETDG